MQQVITELRDAGIGEVLTNEPLAEYTTWKIGGPADLFIIPQSKEQLIRAVRILHHHQIPWRQLGKGSNMLISDKGIRGAVIKLGKAMDELRFDDNLVFVSGSYSMPRLSVMAAKHGLTGLEFAGGIPGSVGGAVYMNAGALGSDVSRVLLSAEVVLETGELLRLHADDLQFAYRHSWLQSVPGIVTEAVFRLEKGDRDKITAALASNREHRVKTQPLQLACAGSVFRNPGQDYAARLIESSGLKGMRCGGAEVSMQHANFIVNTGKATARDVLTLMEQIQAIVKEQHGVDLIPEVLLVGEC